MTNDISADDMAQVLSFFKELERDRQLLRAIGIHQTHQQTVIRNPSDYLFSLSRGIFRIDSKEELGFYEIIGVVAMETLGDDWIKGESLKKPEERSVIYKIISILGATGHFEKIIQYDGKRIKSEIPRSGFSKNFLTLAYDIFCLRDSGYLPEDLIERLKSFDGYQGARYEIAVAAIFCRLGYSIDWFDIHKKGGKRPEFVARKGGYEVYVEAKSRHISGVNNKVGEFDELKASKASGWGKLINQALEKEKEIPKNKPYIVFIDINAANDGEMPPKWVGDVRKTLKNQHLKELIGKPAPFTNIYFTNYSYHYDGLSYAKKGVCFVYQHEKTLRFYDTIEQKGELLNAVHHYGFIPEYHIPGPMTVLQKSTEYPSIKNIFKW